MRTTLITNPLIVFIRNSFSVKEIWAIAMRENRTQIDYHVRQQIEQSFRKLGFEKDSSGRERQGILGATITCGEEQKHDNAPQVSSVLLENKWKCHRGGLNDDDTIRNQRAIFFTRDI